MTLETEGLKKVNRADFLPLKRPLIALQLLGVAFAFITMVLYIMSIPRYYNELVSSCILQGCGLWVPAMPLENSSHISLTLETYAVLFVMIDCVFTFVYYAAALLIYWKGFREPMGLLAALTMVVFGTAFPSLTSVASQHTDLPHAWFMAVNMLGWIGLSLLFLLFPNGTFVPKWTIYVFIITTAFSISNLFFEGNLWTYLEVPAVIQFFWYGFTTMTLIYAQIYRFRKVSSPAQRQQTKWVVYGISIGMSGFIVMSILFNPSLNDGTALTYVYLNALLHLSLMAIPVTFTIAVLRRRLWDIDPLVKRTLVYVALSISVAAIYIFSVLYLSRLFETKDNLLISLVATVVVAVAFAPLREWLQRAINRVMKGRHDDPYAVLLELGSQLIRPMAPEEMLRAVAATIKDSLRLPYTGISIGVGGQDTLVAAMGDPASEVISLPIIHRGQSLGSLHLCNRWAGEAFSAEDDKFLEVLLRQAGPIVENVHMTLGMKLLAADLQESRERLVLAREEERRQIRNNLHDDLAPRLAALALNAATAEKYVEKQPAIAIEMLADLRTMIRSTVSEIRTLVHDLRPPSLDELGLIGAIQERIAELNKPAQLLSDELGTKPLRIRMAEPPALPALPAAVEVAAYRIITESLVNVVKHSQATACSVQLLVSATQQLVIEVIDNGPGVSPGFSPGPGSGSASGSSGPFTSGKGGIGLVSLRERAAELGGQCTIERMEQGGTRVMAILPLYERRTMH